MAAVGIARLHWVSSIFAEHFLVKKDMTCVKEDFEIISDLLFSELICQPYLCYCSSFVMGGKR